MSKTKTAQTWSLASASLHDAYTDFILSRQAMNCTPVPMSFYKFAAGKFLEWIESQNVTWPDRVTGRHVRQFLAELAGRGLQATTRHDYACAIRTLRRFWHAEEYIPQPITFEMHKLEKKRLPVLTVEQLRQIVTEARALHPVVLFVSSADKENRNTQHSSCTQQDVCYLGSA